MYRPGSATVVAWVVQRPTLASDINGGLQVPAQRPASPPTAGRTRDRLAGEFSGTRADRRRNAVPRATPSRCWPPWCGWRNDWGSSAARPTCIT